MTVVAVPLLVAGVAWVGAGLATRWRRPAVMRRD